MGCLYDLIIKYRDCIRERAGELCESNPNLKNSCLRDHQVSLDILLELLLDLSAKEGNVPGSERLFQPINVKVLEPLVYQEENDKTLTEVLMHIKDAVRDTAFQEVKDSAKLYKIITQNDQYAHRLQAAIHSEFELRMNYKDIFKKVVSLTPFGIFMCEQDRFIFANTVVEQLSGYTGQELRTMSIADVLHPDYKYILNENFNIWQENKEISYNKHECKIITKGGAEVWLEISAGQLVIGEKQWILGTAMDITAQKDMENNLTRSERKYKSIFNLSPDMIYLIDTKTKRISDANAVMLHTLKITQEELRSKTIYDFHDKDHADELIDSLNSLMQGNEIKGLNVKIKNGYGEQFDIEVKCTPVIEKGEVAKVLCLARDVTERKKIDELTRQAHESTKLLNETLEYDKIKTEFLSNLSHEFRTPLNVILGSLQLIDLFYNQSTDANGERVRKYYTIMRQNCYRLLRLVNNLIDLNKLDAGYMNVNIGNHDIVNIISNIAASVTDYIESKGLEFNFESNVDSKIIACDPDKIERIILNLLSNAIKFTKNGGQVRLSLWDNESSLFIRVKDSGIGIPKEKQNLIFKRFVQIDKALSSDYHGSGIGLSLVKSLVELHGGSIVLQSESGEGCEFTIELPSRLVVAETSSSQTQNVMNNKIEMINVEFSDIYAV